MHEVIEQRGDADRRRALVVVAGLAALAGLGACSAILGRTPTDGTVDAPGALDLPLGWEARPPGLDVKPGADGKSPGADGKSPGADGKLPGTDFKAPYSGTFPSGKGDLTATLVVGGVARTVGLYLPASLPSSPPLMLLFHGTHGKPADMLSPYTTFARELADKQGLVLAAPQARKLTTPDWDNHVANDIYWETYPGTDPTKNPDLLLVQAIIQEAVRAYGVDGKRVYALGHSSGAFFTILVATSLPDKIAAFVENAGGLVRCAGMKDCTFQGSGTSCTGLATQPGWCSCNGAEKPGPLPTAGRKPPGYLSHSSDDNVVSVYYTCQLASRMTTLGYTTAVHLGSNFGHSIAINLAIDAWPFLSQHTLP